MAFNSGPIALENLPSSLDSYAIRRRTEDDARRKQNQIYEDEAARNTLAAQRDARTQSTMMQADSQNPRTVTDTSMTISAPTEGATVGGSRASAGTRTPGSGGFGTSVPNIDGRYMNLVEYQQPAVTSSASAPKATLGEGTFGPPDATAYQDAAFARLKDKSGQLGQGALASLAATLGGRGISGHSGTFGRGLNDILARTVQPLADLNVEHLGQEYGAATRERGLSEQRAATEYSGDITQRGQDIGAQQAMNNLLAMIAQLKYQGEISQRGQDLDQMYRML